MNHIYRLVWNECTGTWVAVAENARSRGKGSGRAARKAFLCALIASGFSISSAMAELPATTVVPASGKTNAYISANGVPVVNIETANAAGLSHNFYTSYNVQANGLVLNNGNNSQVARQSQLAGQVIANLNLVNEARIILNEVVSTSRSTLAGFTEVLGGRADVVVANPNGITCNGCGFINTDRVTLTSGTPNIGGAGSLAGFTVNRGDVLIEGVGANANTQQIFDIVARSVKVDGKINTIAGGSLGITVGNNAWDYTNRNVTGSVAGVGVAPSYAFDSTVLGGMYAGRIHIVATEAGVGVRMLGEAAASADDFTLTSAGKIEIQSAISAARDTSITTTSASGSQDLLLSGATAKLSASRDLALFATSGQIKLSEGELYAANNLTLTGATLSDVSTAAKTRFAGVNNTLVTTGSAAIDGGVWGAGSALSGSFDSLAIGAGGATIYAGTTLGLGTVNNLSLATAAVRSAGDMTLVATLGAISTANGAAQGIQTTAGNLSLTAGNGLSNAGTITSDAGSVTTRINGTLTNSGTLHAKTTLDMADKANGSTENISNSGILLADGSMAAGAANFINTGVIRASTGTTLNATNLTNSSTFIASDSSGANASLTLTGAFDNQSAGIMQSKGALAVNSGGTLTNSGKLLTLSVANGGNAGALNLSGSTLTNSGFVDGSGLTTLTATNTSGTTFNNSNQLHSTGAFSLNSGGNVSNTGSLIGDAALSLTTGQASFNLDNSGRVQSGGIMTLGGANHVVALTNQLAGIVFSNDALSLTGGNLDNQGKIYANAGANMTLVGLTNGSVVNSSALIFGAMSTGASTITGSGVLNNYGAIHSNDSFTLSATGVTNQNTGGISSLTTLSVTAGSGKFDNYGALYAGNQLTAQATAGNLTNYVSTGTLDSAGSMNLTAGSTFTNNSTINATQDITISAPTFRNEIPGGAPTPVTDFPIWGANNLYSSTGGANGGVTNWQNKTGVQTEFFLTALPAIKPQIIAGRNMNVSGFTSAFNSGGVLSASSGTMNITGVGTFINNDLSLKTTTYLRSWSDTNSCSFWSCAWTYNIGQVDTIISVTTAFNAGAGIFARTLNVTGFNLVNQSSPWAASPNSRSQSSTSSGTAVNVAGANGATLSFAGLNLTLPSNPNGYFVASRNPNAQYLVETNPLFSVGSNFVGTDYMDRRYGYNPDTKIKRLGDSNYEAYLIRQQLIEQTGNNVIKGYGDETAQMQRLMDQALDQGKNLGLIYGKQLTSEQIAGLKQDIVWMEEVEVAGQKVLAPHVYLAQSTRDMITGGAVIAGDNVNLDVTSLSNTGGSISGGDTLKITSKGDITNTSGNIGGGKVSLKSTEGSIRNETITQGSGNSEHFATAIGKTAGITATGDLEMDAAKDISVKGGDVKAGGDASLAAGGNITFDTIVNKSTDTTKEGTDGGMFGTSTSSTTTTSNEKNIGSNLASGGKLKLKSGGDTTIAGSAVQADGGLDVDAGGSFNVLARQDKTTTKTTSEKSGFGVGGGVYGSEKTTTDNFKGTNKGSTIQVGKAEDQEARVAALQELRDKNKELSSTTDNLLALKADYKKATPGSPEAVALKEKYQAELATYKSQIAESKDIQVQLDAIPSGDLNVKAGKSMVLQGSDLNVAGNADIYAKDGIDILDGLDEERTTTTTTTTTFLKMDGEGGKAESEAGSKTDAKLASASASTGASAGASSDDNLKLMETSTTRTHSGSRTSVASNLNVGGNLKAKSDGTINIQGSNITAGGDLSLDAKDINVLAGRNEEFSNTSTTTTSVGFYEQSGADASAGAGANANGAKASANANASAEANAETTITIGARTEESNESSYNLTHSKSSIKAGGNIDMKAKNRALFVGADVESGGDMTIEAKDIVNLAARDVSTTTTSNTQTTAGLYVGAEANASGSAESRAGAHVTGEGVKPLSGAASGEASAEASAGVRFNQESSKTSESSVTNVTNTFKAGGNFKRTATDTILDEGTSIEAEGNIEQSARVIKENAIHDTTSESSSTDSHDARVGVYAGAEAGGGGDTQGKVEAPDADAAYGVKASYKGGSSNESNNSSTAVTSKYKAGGSITSKSTEKTTFVGTQFEAGKDVNIEAGSLDYQAARDSTSSTSSSNEIDASGKVALGGTKVGGSAEASFGKEGESEKSSTAQRGSINALGNVRIKTTQGDANFEGTKIDGKDNVSVDSAGDVNFKAAYDTSESSSNSVNASANIGIGKSEAEGGVSGGYSQSNNSSKTAQVGGISGNNISIKAANDVNMEGTKLKSQSDTSIEAGNNVNLKAAENTETSTSFGADASLSASNEGENGKLGVNAGYSTNVSSETTGIDSGGKLSIKGKTITSQEADLTAQEGTQITGKVANEKAANYGFEVGLDISASQGGAKPSDGAKPGDSAKPNEGAKTNDDIP